MARQLDQQALHRVADTAAALPLADRRNRVMWLNNDRVFYAGLLGPVSVRTMGGWLVYASLGAPLRIALGDAATGLLADDAPLQSTDLAWCRPTRRTGWPVESA